MKRRTALFLMALALPGPVAPALAAKPSPAMLSESCGACHGTRGASAGPTIPTIGGQSASYLASTLNAFRDGRRPSSVMGRLAKGFARDDYVLMGNFFAAQPFVPARQSPDSALAARGRNLHDVLCERCHAGGGRRFADEEAKAPGPILAGQWLPYLLIAFNEFIARERPLPAGMDEAFQQLKRGDAEALAHFYAARP